MKEIEVKILDIDEKDITNKLLKLGAKKISEELVVEKAFDFEDGRIFKNNNLLRLRKIGDKTELTYKDSREEDKDFAIREETQTEIKDFYEMEKIIKKLGLKCIIHREKKRSSFELNKVRFEIDKYPTIPAYLEIEGTKEDIKKTLQLLNIEVNKISNLPSTEVLKNYKVDPYSQKF